MRKIQLIYGAALIVALSSCSVTTPLSVSAAPVGSRVGVSKTGYLFWFFQLNKNYGIAEAAHNGNITGGVGAADIKNSYTPVSFIYRTSKITVYGN